jgi:iron complex outermembrane recepter protein
MSREFKTAAVTRKNNRCIDSFFIALQQDMLMHKTTPIHRAALLALGAALATSAAAQEAPAAAGQRIEVTGSRIKRVDAETASPVQVINREQIERTGKQSIQEVLRGVTADGQGSIPPSFTAGFASGSAAISLRGLGVNSTLVLVNGRRMTTYGLADDGARNFVDLNTIPLEAVDRIEILKDGASAIYGADAVGGVVNVILRKDYSGASIAANAGQSGKNDGRITRASASLGLGNLDSDRYNVFFTLEASQQKNIRAIDRGFIGQADLTSRGYFDFTNGAPRPYAGLGPTSNSPFGVVRRYTGDPAAPFGPRLNVLACPDSLGANGLCQYNPRIEDEIQPAVDRLNLFGRGTLQFSPSLTAYAEIGFFQTKTKASGGLAANNDGGVFLPNAGASNPLLVHGPMNLPAAHPDNTQGEDVALFIRPFELGGTDQKTDNQVLRLVQGLQGNAFGWDYDIGAAFIKSRLKNTSNGFIIYDAMQAALDNGTYRITNPSQTDPAVLAAIAPTLVNTPTSSIKSIDFKASRDLMKLSGGQLALALGAEYRLESANTPALPGQDTGAIVGLGYSAFSAKRKVGAVFGEVNAPVTPWLELNGALRFDKYSDVGNSTTPKVGFKLKPMEGLALRGTYAEAFRAPSPAESGGSSFGFTFVGILSQGDPKLKPETAKSFTLGLVAEPLPGTSATIDYWRIDRKNEITQADPNLIIPAGQCINSCDGLDDDGNPDGSPSLINQRLAGAQPNTFMYYGEDGSLSTVTGFFQNATKTLTDGIDVELRHRLRLGSFGQLDGQLNWTHINKYRRTDAFGETFDYAGTHGPVVQSSGGGTPRDRVNLSLTWDRAEWAVTGAVSYVGRVKMVNHKGETTPQDRDPATGELTGDITNPNTGVTYPDNGQYACGVFDTSGNVVNGCRLPSFTTFDLFARWSPVKNLDLNFSIQNLFDRQAPFDPYLAGSYATNYNQSWHQAGAVGRFFTVGAKYTF